MKELFALIAFIGFIISVFAAYITHLVWWVRLAMNEELDTISEAVLAIIGTIAPPIGVLHGYLLWF